MKILTGKFRNRNFYMPADIRPTQNMLRKAVFDIIGHDLSGMSFCDIFAGSGAMGLEALSCGADEVVMVEKDPRHVAIIKENVELLQVDQAEQKVTVRQADGFAYIKAVHAENKQFDVVFLDPPYGLKLVKKALKVLEAYDILRPHCYLILQFDKYDNLPKELGRFSILTERKYGSSYLAILTRANT